MSTQRRRRAGLARRFSWLVVATMVVAALAPAPVLAIPGDPTIAPNAESRELVDGNPTCAQDQYYAYKIDGSPTNGTHGPIIISNATSNSFDWAMTAQAMHDYDMDAVIVKAGDNGYVYLYQDNTDDSDTNLVSPGNNGGQQANTSHVEFCFDQKEGPDPTPTPTPTATPEPTPTATPEPTPTATPEPTPTATPTATPEPTPTATPQPTPGQFAFPTIGLTDCEEPGGQGSIVVSGFAATNGGELVLNPGAGEIVITENGTYPLEPGTYSAIVRFEGETVAGPTDFTIEACPAEPTPTPVDPAFSVLVQTPVCDGDVPYLDYEVDVVGTESDTVTITFLHPTDSSQNVVYADLPFSGRVLWPGAVVDAEGMPVDWPGWRFEDGIWVEGDEFDWVRPSVEVRFEVNPEATVTVDYPPSSPLCDANPPEGEVDPATGTPGTTLPPTDTVLGTAAPAGDGWRLIVLAMAGLLAAALLLTPASAVVVRREDESRG